jgi:apolipoprotein N-acyltransferase
MRNSVLGQSSLAWTLGIVGLFIFPPVCWGLGAILGYSALTKATDNLDVFSKRDVAVCGIGTLANVILFFWWAIQLVGLL